MISRILRSIIAMTLAALVLVPGAHAQGEPALTIVSPAAGQKVTRTDIPVKVAVSNFTLDCSTVGRPDEVGRGHIHVMLDGMSMAVLTNFYCHDTFTISGQGLKPGPHKLIIDLASNTHLDMEKTVKEVAFDYEPSAAPPSLPASQSGTPSARIEGLADGATVGPRFSFRVVPTNFTPSANLEGKPNVLGYGHYHVFIDMAPMSSSGMMSLAGMVGMPGSNTVSLDLRAWPSGKHTLTLELVQDDHTPYASAQPVMVTFTLNNPATTRPASTAAAGLPKTGGDPYALPGAVLGALLLIGAGAGLRRRWFGRHP